MDIQLHLEPEVALFYTRLALSSGRTLGTVLADALFLLAGQLSAEAIAQNQSEKALHGDDGRDTM